MEWRSAEVVRRCKAGEMVCVAWECGLRAAVGAERERGGCARRGKGVRVSVGSACGVEKRAKRVSAFGVIMRAEKGRECCAVVPHMRFAAEELFRSGKTEGNCDRTSVFNGARFVFGGETGEKRETHTLFF